MHLRGLKARCGARLQHVVFDIVWQQFVQMERDDDKISIDFRSLGARSLCFECLLEFHYSTLYSTAYSTCFTPKFSVI